MRQGPPEGRNVQNRNTLDVSDAQKVGVCAHQIVRRPGHGTFEDLVVRRVPTPLDLGQGLHEQASAPQKAYKSAGLDRIEAELLEDFRPTEDVFDLGEDWFGKEEGE